MLQTQVPGQFGKDGSEKTDFERQVKMFRTGVMITMGLFAGTVLGGVVGLFVYANSRQPNVHDGVFAVIQVVGVLLGLAMGYLAARGAEAQEQLLEASQRAGITMLKKYRPKPGNSGHSNVGQRVMNTGTTGEEFLNKLLSGPNK
jgi:MFS family permease